MRPLFVACALLTLSGASFAATLRDTVFSLTVPPSAAGCATPAPTPYFVNTDAYLYFYVDLNLNPGEALSVKWSSPTGDLNSTANFTAPSSSGHYCYWSSKAIGANPAKYTQGTWTADASINGRLLLHKTVMVTGPDIPSIDRGGVVNTASFTRGSGILAPGTLVSITGHLLAPDYAEASGSPLPTSLLGVSVTVNGTPAGIVDVSPEEVDIQLPWSMPADSAQIQVNNNGNLTNPERILTGGASPGVFLDYNQSGNAALVYRFGADGTDYGFSDPTNPLQRGDTAVFYVTGLGVTQDPPPNFSAGNQDSTPILPVTLAFGGVRAQAIAVMAQDTNPYSIGVSYIVATVPKEAGNGNAVPITISAAGVKANSSTVAIGGTVPTFTTASILSATPLVASSANNGVINPFATLALQGSNIHTHVPTYVRFSASGVSPITVPASTVDTDIVTAIVPPYADPQTHIFSNGKWQVNLLQVLGGQVLASNPMSIQVAPVYKTSSPTGTVSSAILATVPQAMRTNAAAQIYKQEISNGARYNAPASVQVANEIVTGLRPIVGGLQEVAGNAASDVALGNLNGQALTISNDNINALDALLSALYTEHLRAIQAGTVVSTASARWPDLQPEGILGQVGSAIRDAVFCGDETNKTVLQQAFGVTCPDDPNQGLNQLKQAGIDTLKQFTVDAGQVYKVTRWGTLAVCAVASYGACIAVAAVTAVSKDINMLTREAGWIESNPPTDGTDQQSFDQQARDDVMSHLGDDVQDDVPDDVKTSLNSVDQQFNDKMVQFAQNWSIDQPVASVGLPTAIQEAQDTEQNAAVELLAPRVVTSPDGSNSLDYSVDNSPAVDITVKVSSSNGTPLEDSGVELTSGDDSQLPYAIAPTLGDGSAHMMIPSSAIGNSVPNSAQFGISLLDETGETTRFDGPLVNLANGSQSLGSYKVSYDSDNDGDDDSDGTLALRPKPLARGAAVFEEDLPRGLGPTHPTQPAARRKLFHGRKSAGRPRLLVNR